jgi:hypothetical protein
MTIQNTIIFIVAGLVSIFTVEAGLDIFTTIQDAQFSRCIELNFEGIGQECKR